MLGEKGSEIAGGGREVYVHHAGRRVISVCTTVAGRRVINMVQCIIRCALYVYPSPCFMCVTS